MITYLENYLIRWDDFQGKVRSIVFYLKTNHITSPIDLYQGGEFCKNKKKESLKLDDFFIVFSRNLNPENSCCGQSFPFFVLKPNSNE